MKGFVPTPAATVDVMVHKLFSDRPPKRDSRLLDPGCGHGAFMDGVIRWCDRNRAPCPEIVGIELDPSNARRARSALGHRARVTILEGDFLTCDVGSFDYIIGNPPYVAIEELSEGERAQYRAAFSTARGRLDLYLLFWERALQIARPGGRIVFITPEKYTYVETAKPLRMLLTKFHVEELLYFSESTFPGLTTYPVITTVSHTTAHSDTRIHLRTGSTHAVRLPRDGGSWQPAIHRSPSLGGSGTLADVATRVSCGVATGADKSYLFDAETFPREFLSLVSPVISGRDLRHGSPFPVPRQLLLMPYDDHGELLPLDELGAAADYLSQPAVRARLEARTCATRKPWYAFHETPPLREMLLPKLVCKDITKEPFFWIDREGGTIPLHSTYYVVPRRPQLLEPLADYLNSQDAVAWLRANCQRAANGFLRMQSAVLKRLPVPDTLLQACSGDLLAA